MNSADYAFFSKILLKTAIYKSILWDTALYKIAESYEMQMSEPLHESIIIALADQSNQPRSNSNTVGFNPYIYLHYSKDFSVYFRQNVVRMFTDAN